MLTPSVTSEHMVLRKIEISATQGKDREIRWEDQKAGVFLLRIEEQSGPTTECLPKTNAHAVGKR